MKIIKKILQALFIIFIGNFNFFFIEFCVDSVDFKGIMPLVIFFPFVFTIAGTHFLFYDYFYAKVKKVQNKIIRIMLSLILVLLILLIAIILQIGVFYVDMELVV